MKYIIIKALLVAATTLDADSSWKATSRGYREANPLFASHGQYRAKGLTLEFGITGGVLLVDYFHTRHHPERRKRMAISELTATGVKLGIAAHNYHTIYR